MIRNYHVQEVSSGAVAIVPFRIPASMICPGQPHRPVPLARDLEAPMMSESVDLIRRPSGRGQQMKLASRRVVSLRENGNAKSPALANFAGFVGANGPQQKQRFLARNRPKGNGQLNRTARRLRSGQHVDTPMKELAFLIEPSATPMSGRQTSSPNRLKTHGSLDGNSGD